MPERVERAEFRAGGSVAERHAAEIGAENLAQQLDFAGRCLAGVVDESEAVRRPQPLAPRGVGAQRFDGQCDRIASGQPAFGDGEIAITRVEFRENLREIDLPPVLPAEFGRRDGERIVIRVFDARQQRRVCEVGRLPVKLGRTGERTREKLLRLDERIAQPSDEAKGRREKPVRRTQAGNFGIELLGGEFVPFQREERCARGGENGFGFDVVDQHYGCAGIGENVGCERTESMRLRKPQRLNLRLERARARDARRERDAFSRAGCARDRYAGVEGRLDGAALLVGERARRNHRAKRSGAGGGRCAHAVA